MSLNFIINPVAGKGLSLKAIPIIEKICEAKGIPYKIEITKGPGDATNIARKMASQNPMAIIAVGGDGTILETANGLIGSNTPLGIIPLGTGNDFARSFNIPIGIKSVEECLRVILSGDSTQVDVGRFKDHVFLNIASIGFDAEIIEDLPKIKQFVKGKSAYFLSVFFKLITYKKKNIRLTIDGQVVNTDIFLVAICNGISYGGGMKVNPNGLLDDGYFDLIVIKPVPKYKVPFLLIKFMKGLHLNLPYVKAYRCKNINIASVDNLVINADGDLIGKTPVDFTIAPYSLKVITARS